MRNMMRIIIKNKIETQAVKRRLIEFVITVALMLHDR